LEEKKERLICNRLDTVTHHVANHFSDTSLELLPIIIKYYQKGWSWSNSNEIEIEINGSSRSIKEKEEKNEHIRRLLSVPSYVDGILRAAIINSIQASVK
jgi:hypothetical protein